ncbi:MAG: helix-turn-helix domain-containing protein, partial [Gemmatimonadales bacterium]
VVTLTLPPLRDRREDIAELVDSYITRFRVQLGRPVRGISPEALQALESYSWPGNVRELVNVMERAVLLCKGTELSVEDLPDIVVAPAARESAGEMGTARSSLLGDGDLLSRPLDAARVELVERFEREYLARLLRSTGGRIGEAARQAGISPRTLYNKMKRYDLSKEDFKP